MIVTFVGVQLSNDVVILSGCHQNVMASAVSDLINLLLDKMAASSQLFYFDSNFIEVCSQGSHDKRSALVQVMA